MELGAGAPITRHDSTRVNTSRQNAPQQQVSSPETSQPDANASPEDHPHTKRMSVWVHGKKSLLSHSSQFLAKGSGGVVYRYAYAFFSGVTLPYARAKRGVKRDEKST